MPTVKEPSENRCRRLYNSLIAVVSVSATNSSLLPVGDALLCALTVHGEVLSQAKEVAIMPEG
jgi:hypothetical protein